MDLLKHVIDPHCLANGLSSFDAKCLQLFISRSLSLGIICGACILKVPQILKILRAKGTGPQKVAGINKLSLLGELLCFAIIIAFNRSKAFPFSTYGETFFIALQNLIIVFLIDWYSNPEPTAAVSRTALAWAAFGGLLAVLLSPGLLPPSALQILMGLTIPLFSASRVPQIWQNFRTGSTGQLALATSAMAFAGSLARVFTTLQEAKDNLLLLGFAVGALLNGILAAQILYYGTADEPQKKKKKSS